MGSLKQTLFEEGHVIAPWYVPVILWIIIGKVLASYILKKIVGQHSRTTRFFIQFLFCALAALLWGAFAGQLSFDTTALLIIAIGFLNALGAYAHWIAIDISLSRASLYLIFDDLIAMALGYFILSEGSFLNAGLAAGIMLSLCGATFYPIYKSKKSEWEHAASEQKSGETAKRELTLLVCVLVFSVVWGLAFFSMRYFGLQNIHPAKFLWNWYGGAALGGLVLFLTDRTKRRTMTMRDLGEIAASAACIFGALACAYWARTLAPLIGTQPIFLVSEIIVPTLIGLYVFKEGAKLDGAEKFLLSASAAGGILVALSF